MDNLKVIKRDGRVVEFDSSKIFNALENAFWSTHSLIIVPRLKELTSRTVDKIKCKVDSENKDKISVEEIQDIVEDTLIAENLPTIAKEYILYRNKRNEQRELKSNLMTTMKELTFTDSSDLDLKRENGNIDGDTAMGTMLRYGSETAKAFYKLELIDPVHSRAHNEGYIHIHDLDFYALTETCCQIDIQKLFEDGFSTGHGYLREPSNIMTFGALTCIAIQANQNEQHGGQSIPNFDYAGAKYVAKTYIKEARNITDELLSGPDTIDKTPEGNEVERILTNIYTVSKHILDKRSYVILQLETNIPQIKPYIKLIEGIAFKRTIKQTYQAMEAVIHNLNTMHCFHPDQKVKVLSIESSKDIDKMSENELNALKDLLKDLYENQKLTMKEVREEIGVTQKILYKLFDKFNIQIRSRQDNYESKSNLYKKEHGVDNPMKLQDVKDKLKSTQKANHNGVMAFNTDKQKQTCLERYGCENPMQNEEVIQKCVESNKQNHQGVHNLQSEEFRQEMKEKYGCNTYPAFKFMRDKDTGVMRTKIEKEIAKLLTDEFPDLIINFNKRSLIPSNGKLEVDIYFPSLKFGIEINGNYSHNKDAYLTDLKNNTYETKESMKEKLLRNEGIELMHIWEDDFKSNKHLVYNDILYYIYRILMGGSNNE